MAVNERPILFSDQMVRAILENRKCVTRRVVKPQPPEWVREFGFSYFTQPGCISACGNYGARGPAEKWIKMPYPPGVKLWVRETWTFEKYHNIDGGDGWREGTLKYRSDGEHLCDVGTWRPSIFMPRWASRISLEVTGVRVERLREITPEDARSEGIIPHAPDGWVSGDQRDVLAFSSLWDSINGKKHPWESNPWVWVISFRKLAPESPQ